VKLHYYPETDSLYVEFQRRPSVDTREIAQGVRLDLDEQGRPVGLDIDHASTILDLETLDTVGLPLPLSSHSALLSWRRIIPGRRHAHDDTGRLHGLPDHSAHG
jgi:uncharacterized protein YuzE